MFREVLLVKSMEVVNIIGQMTTLVIEGQDVFLEVHPIEKLQLFWTYL